MFFFSYIKEIKSRFIYFLISTVMTFIIIYIYSEKYLYYLTKSFVLLDFPKHREFIFTDMTEPIFTYLYMSFLITCFFVLPFFAYNIFSFFKSSFYQSESLIILKEIILLFVFNCLSFYFFLNYIIPKVCQFFLNFEQKDGIILLFLEAKISSFIKFFVYFIYLEIFLSFLIFFVIFGIKKNHISFKLIKSLKKKFLFLSILISAFISPPDLIAQISLTLLLLIFYEIIFIYALYKRNQGYTKRTLKTH